MNQKILILGGTGAVGRHVCRLLSSSERAIFVASRTVGSAANVADGLENATAVAIDVTVGDANWPDGLSLVINCTGIERLEIAKQTASLGADYIDISASSNYLASLENLNGLFATANTRCLIGVGLSPGLSTLLAKSIVDPESPGPIEIHLLLDNRDEHGPQSAVFTTGLIGRDFPDSVSKNLVRNFCGLRRVEFPEGFGHRLVARADLADQNILHKDCGVTVTTTYGFTNSAVLIAISLASRFPWLGAPLVRQAIRLPRPKSVGRWVGFAAAGNRRIWATGTGQARGTAVMTSIAGECLLNRQFQPGVQYFGNLVDLNDTLIESLATHGIKVGTDEIIENA